MLKRIIFTLALLASAVTSYAATTTFSIAVTVAPGAKAPADHYRVKEQINGVWGDPAGATGPFLVVAPTSSIAVPTTSTTPIFEVIPVTNGKEGTPSNSCTIVSAGSDEVVTIVCKPAQ